MELNEKLQELRKQRGLTQEELAEKLYVSRTAISKWESGRGVPNIESLKAISKFFAVTLDDLLSSDELLVIAEEDHSKRESHIRDKVFAALDCSTLLLLFLPFFGQKTADTIQGVSLFTLTAIPLYLKTTYWIAVIGMVVAGIVTFALQTCDHTRWVQLKYRLSLALNAFCVILFIMSQQPYAAVFVLTMLAIKALMLIKHG